MAQTGKTVSLKKSSATSKAIWRMSRALSAPVTAHVEPSPRRPSLVRTKALSLDTYSSSPSDSLSPSLGVLQEHLSPGDTVTEGANPRASPSIEVIPPDKSDDEITAGTEQVGLEPRSRSVSPKTSAFNAPTKSNKYSLLTEKRKKLLTKSSRIEDDSLEAFPANKRHSSSPENNWEQIQEWMVWCIHENLDDISDDDTEPFNPCSVRSLLSSTCHPAQHPQQLLSPHDPVRRNQQRLQDMHLAYHSSPSPVSARHTTHKKSPVLLQTRSFSGTDNDPIVYSEHRRMSYQPEGRRSPVIATETVRKQSPSNQSRSGSKSPLNRNLLNPESARTLGVKPKYRNTLSLDSHFSGQSSFESSSSSRMDSFDSTGTHNEKI